MKLAKRCLLRNIKGEAKQANRQGDENKSENMSSRQGHRDPQEGLSPSSWLSPAEQIFPSEPPERKTQKNDRKGGDEGDSCFFLTKLTVINRAAGFPELGCPCVAGRPQEAALRGELCLLGAEQRRSLTPCPQTHPVTGPKLIGAVRYQSSLAKTQPGMGGCSNTVLGLPHVTASLCVPSGPLPWAQKPKG